MRIFVQMNFLKTMKQFLKTAAAVIAGCLIAGGIMIFIFFGIIGSLASLGKSQPAIPHSAVLRIDLSTVQLGEQTREADLITAVSGNQMQVLGILDAVRAVNTAASDPAIRYIYLKPDMAAGGMAEIEELRQAISGFRKSGKAVISYIENPTNAGFYLASASDKVYMTPHAGGMNMFAGISSQMVFLKDILSRFGVNVQLIRHGKYKSAGEMFVRNEASPENLAQNQELVDALWDSWSSSIAESRGLSKGALDSMIDGLELNVPEDFLNAGLVDGLLTSDEMEIRLKEYFDASGSEKPAMVSLADYAAAKVVPDFRAENRVAVIYADGNIIDGSEEQQVAGDRFARMISEIRKDESIKAVVLRVNSPGGSVLAAEKIRDEIMLLTEEKPVIASFGDYAASGGYWISAGCDYIFTNSSTITGSIGVFSMIPDFSKTLDDIAHINVTTVNSNAHSDIYSCLRPLTGRETAYMQESVESIYRTFTGLVAEGRSLDTEYVDSIAQGRVWSGDDALRLRLADMKGTLTDALNYAVTASGAGGELDEWDIVEYPKPMTAIEMLIQSLGGYVSASVFKDTPFADVEAAFKDWDHSRSGQVYARLPYELEIIK